MISYNIGPSYNDTWVYLHNPVLNGVQNTLTISRLLILISDSTLYVNYILSWSQPFFMNNRRFYDCHCYMTWPPLRMIKFCKLHTISGHWLYSLNSRIAFLNKNIIPLQIGLKLQGILTKSRELSQYKFINIHSRTLRRKILWNLQFHDELFKIQMCDNFDNCLMILKKNYWLVPILNMINIFYAIHFMSILLPLPKYVTCLKLRPFCLLCVMLWYSNHHNGTYNVLI